MKFNWGHLRSLFYLYVLLIVIYTLLRIVFMRYNATDFDITSNMDVFKTIVNGLRFDLSSILLCNLLFSVLWLLPFGKWWKSKSYQLSLKILFIVVNGFFILLNVIDIVYFPFVKKRMQKDAFLFFTGDKGNEVYTLLPTILLQFWYIWLFLIILIYLMIKFYDKITTNIKRIPFHFNWFYMPIILLILGLELIGIRGGLQLRPLAVIDASHGTSIQNIPYVLNSTFSIIRTWGKKSIEEKHFYNESAFNECEKPIKSIQPIENHGSKKLNVVIIMVESLSKSYLSWYKGSGNTPFLDSLMRHSYVFNNGFANARESVQGVPAVLASIPSWMDEPFIFSKYASNQFNSIASITKPYGYKSYFFHGAARGTMGFYAFTNLAGFDKYYSKTDYPDESHFDGAWGIWDHHFLPFMVDKLNKASQPFFAATLTINTHHPFKTPEDFKVNNPSEKYPILNTLPYADASLKAFFELAAKQPWFPNTLFVITADHTGPKIEDVHTTMDDYRIPILFYKPDNSLTGYSDSIINQIDIMPAILSMIGIEKKIFSFGQNIWEDSCPHFHLDYKSGIYQYVDYKYCLHFDGTKTIAVYDWKNDLQLRQNLVNHAEIATIIEIIETRIKKNIQVFNNSMIYNKMLTDAK